MPDEAYDQNYSLRHMDVFMNRRPVGIEKRWRFAA
jgi:hypothetical protein